MDTEQAIECEAAHCIRDAGPYVAAAYIVFVALILLYVAIMAGKLSRIEGYSEASGCYHAKDGAALSFTEIGQAVSWLYGTSPRGLAGPLPTT